MHSTVESSTIVRLNLTVIWMYIQTYGLQNHNTLYGESCYTEKHTHTLRYDAIPSIEYEIFSF